MEKNLVCEKLKHIFNGVMWFVTVWENSKVRSLPEVLFCQVNQNSKIEFHFIIIFKKYDNHNLTCLDQFYYFNFCSIFKQ